MALHRSSDMTRTFKLPKLPGNSFGEEMLRKNFRKSQLLTPGQGVAQARDIPVDFDTLQVAAATGGADTSEVSQHAGLSLDKKVLRFNAFFKEGVQESPVERERIRKCVIYYYLEDETISVSEPKQDNSGIHFQGNLIKRHQIALPQGSHLTFEHLVVGGNVTIYGKTFHLTDCDSFTRRFLQGVGLEVRPGEDFPVSTYALSRQQHKKTAKGPEQVELTQQMEFASTGKKVKLTVGEIKATKQFLLADRQVLRFEALWDERSQPNGDYRLFKLYYFLADDTIEVVEVQGVNSGRDPFPSFVRRQKCPKASSGNNLTFNKGETQYYTAADLKIGETVNIYGRPFLLYNCDKFTQDFLSSKYGVTDFTPIKVGLPQKELPPREAPPHNGFGDEEDSLNSWKYLYTRPPKKDVAKYMANANNMLKFQLKLDTTEPCDEIRRFALTYYLSDDTISIFEPATRNSGIIGGKFLQRMKTRNPATGEYWKPHELFVGAKVNINKHNFIVYSTDERSLVFMEEHSSSYPRSDLHAITNKLRAMLLSKSTGLSDAIASADVDASGAIDYKDFAAIFAQQGLDVAEQEVLTLLRHHNQHGTRMLHYHDVLEHALQGARAASSDLSWQGILAGAVQAECQESAARSGAEARCAAQEREIAAKAAKAFLETYSSRSTLYNTFFRHAADRSTDGKMGVEEFRIALRGRPETNLSNSQIEALGGYLFPSAVSRVDLNEFIKLLQGTSCFPHTAVALVRSYQGKGRL